MRKNTKYKKRKIKRDSHERGGEGDRGKIIRRWRCNLKNKIHKLEWTRHTKYTRTIKGTRIRYWIWLCKFFFLHNVETVGKYPFHQPRHNCHQHQHRYRHQHHRQHRQLRHQIQRLFNSGSQSSKLCWKLQNINDIYICTPVIIKLSLIHIWRCRRSTLCRSRWSPYH